MITNAFNEIIEMHLKQFQFHEWITNSYASASLVSKIMKILLIDRIQQTLISLTVGKVVMLSSFELFSILVYLVFTLQCSY